MLAAFVFSLLILDANVERITLQDILSLVDDGVREGLHIDFKTGFSGDVWKSALCKDIVAFSNADGGHIVFGVDEKDSQASNAVGLTLEDIKKLINIESIERLISQIQNICSSLAEPAVLGVRVKVIERVNDGRFFLVIYVPPSNAKPHALRSEKNHSFYFFPRRADSSTIEMPMTEVRRSILNTFQQNRMIEDFVLGRRKTILKTQMDGKRFASQNEGVAYVHVIAVPMQTFGQNVFSSAELSTIAGQDILQFSRIVFERTYWHHNLSGWVVGDDKSYKSQVFRDGSCEVLRYLSEFNRGVLRVYDVRNIEGLLVYSTFEALRYQRHLGVSLPIALFMSVEGLDLLVNDVNGKREPARLIFSNHDPSVALKGYETPKRIELPDVLLEEYPLRDEELDVGSFGWAIRDVLNIVWNVIGMTESPNFANGIWSPP